MKLSRGTDRKESSEIDHIRTPPLFCFSARVLGHGGHAFDQLGSKSARDFEVLELRD